MPNDNVALLRNTYEAFGRGDIAAVMAVLAEDIEWNAPEIRRTEVGRMAARGD